MSLEIFTCPDLRHTAATRPGEPGNNGDNMAEVHFLPTLPEGSFIIFPTDWDGGDEYGWVISAPEEYESIASDMGWWLDERGGGPTCSAFEWIYDHAGEDYEDLDEYLENVPAWKDLVARRAAYLESDARLDEANREEDRRDTAIRDELSRQDRDGE